jgi:diaminohydroxyphosphoribosylaminopyrimidine deaminase/5-amino-6-(5-phosphoribosylamino)uracil reductase
MNDYFMKRAIELATLGTGFVNPDPLSGAVIVKDNKIIGEGYYKSYGAVTAEKEALLNMPGDLTGVELYLSIEPFRTEKDAYEVLKLIREKGIQKIYIGMRDPNPCKTVDFISELERMSISYELGLLGEECEELNEIYSYYIKNKSPYVIVKWAMTLDGKLATKTGDSKWISSEESLYFVHQLRQRVAAILVGENTVKLDDPKLTTRLEGVTISNPLRVIISKYGDIPINSNVLQVDDSTKTLIITSEFIPKDKEDELLRKGVQIAKLREINHHIEFKDIMTLLGSMEIDSLFIEGGSSILASAFDSGCIHKVYTTIAPKIVGGSNAITPVGGNGIELMRNAIVLKRISHEIVGPDVIVKGYIY